MYGEDLGTVGGRESRTILKVRKYKADGTSCFHKWDADIYIFSCQVPRFISSEGNYLSHVDIPDACRCSVSRPGISISKGVLYNVPF